MQIVNVLIEHGTYTLDRPFSYVYEKEKQLSVGVRVIVPFNKNVIVGYVMSIENVDMTKEEYIKNIGYEIKEIVDVIDDIPLLSEELMKTASQMSDYYFTPLIKVLQTMLPPSLKPTSGALNKAKIAYEKVLKAIDKEIDGLTAKQVEIYNLIKMSDFVLKRDIKSPSVVKALIEKGYIVEFEKEKQRFNYESTLENKIVTLNDEQLKVVNEFNSTSDLVYLLQGVTGSGKTEVYIELVKEQVKQGKKVIVLVPEISLTPVMMSRFYALFKNRVAILHSELSDGEKYDEYRKIKRGDVDIVIGTRSAVFAPLTNIGLIIIDEEHVESYKQENQPCYHARMVAKMRIEHFDGAKLLLGSATPTLESRARALKNVYHLLRLDKRANESELPHCTIVDMQDHSLIDYDSTLFSLPLRKKIQERLDKNEQVVLLLNRRGYATSYMCRECKEVMKCPECDIPLTYHAKDKLLKCHHCGYVSFIPDECPSCGSKHMTKIGFGIEKVVEEAQHLFKEAKILRLDSDVGRIKNNIATTLAKFREHKGDILIGTQMIAKGHDFPNVTLVGVILADQGLTIANYRASETTFELLAQAIGRAGRGEKNGEAVIQTYMPNHYAISLSAAQNYELFFKEEMRVRKLQQYPPYTFVTTLLISGKDIEVVEETTMEIIENLRETLSEQVSIIGPSVPYISYTHLGHRRMITLKYKNYQNISTPIKQLIALFKKRSTISIVVDVDAL